ncbi:MAG TPA: hypothetical protein VIX89_14970 [Bryobacteraceae bacterium]
MIDGASVLAPAVWRLEIVNVLVVAERRKKIASAKSAKFLRDLQSVAAFLSQLKDEPLRRAAEEVGIAIFQP